MASGKATVAARTARLQEATLKDPMFVPRSRRDCPRFREEEKHDTTPPLRRRGDEDGDEDYVDGCSEALLPGALTRRLSACRPCLTFPPSLPPAPPSNPRLTSSSGSSPCASRPSALAREPPSLPDASRPILTLTSCPLPSLSLSRRSSLGSLANTRATT